MQVRVPRIRIGDNLAQIKAMHLANVQTFGSNVWHPNINLSAPQIDFSCGADRKMAIFMCICVISQRNHNFGADTRIIKEIRWLSFEFLRMQRKISSTPSYVYLRSCLCSKEITALLVVLFLVARHAASLSPCSICHPHHSSTSPIELHLRVGLCALSGKNKEVRVKGC